MHSSKTTDSNPALSNGPSVNAEKVAEPEAILNHVKVSVFPNKTAPAQFIQLDTSLVPIPGLGFGVDEDVLTIGRDPELSKCILDYPEIEPLHAKMVRRSEQQYQLSDCGSLAGTYINYSPVGETGIELCHGDLVHFGRIAFLFTIEDPPCRRTLVVTTNKEINL